MEDKKAIELLVQIAHLAQKAGLLSLEDAVHTVEAIKVAVKLVADKPVDDGKPNE